MGNVHPMLAMQSVDSLLISLITNKGLYIYIYI
jgi:hypothetical protein